MPAPGSPELVAHCGLYCGACRSYLKGRCPGCHGNTKATWCKVRTCCTGRNIKTCAECSDFQDPRDCGKYHNFIAKVIGVVLRSDRAACIAQIRKLGLEGHAQAMADANRQTLRR